MGKESYRTQCNAMTNSVFFYLDQPKQFLKFIKKIERLGLTYNLHFTKVFDREGYLDDDTWDVKWIQIDFRELKQQNENPFDTIDRLTKSGIRNQYSFFVFLFIFLMIFLVFIGAIIYTWIIL